MIDWLKRVFAERPQEPAQGPPERVAEVEAVLADMRPLFRADGGDVRLVRVEAGRVEVRLVGACAHCHASTTTLYEAVEPALKGRFGWVESVHAV